MRVIELLEIIADVSAKNEVIVRDKLGYDYTYFYNTILLYLLKSIPKDADITNITTMEFYNLYELSEKELQVEVPKLYYIYYLNSSCGEYSIRGFKSYIESKNFFEVYDEEYITILIYEGVVEMVSYENK
ncbi:hypothetical protein [Cetobacterium sp.]|uniref:hypothetical protein n=1 Tax=Cetobacterium sp. TaxID=2071632 RepID=UPI003F2C6D36